MMVSLERLQDENGGRLVDDRMTGLKPAANPSEYHGDGQPRAPAKRRVSTKGIGRPGYKRRVNAPYSYVELISMAIKASPHCMLTLREILGYLEENNECFQGSYVGWKNSVRHNLSSSRCFVKLLRNSKRPFGKDNFWAMNPDCTHCQKAKQNWQSSTSMKTSKTSRPSLFQPTTFNDQSTALEPRWQSNDTPPEDQHAEDSTASSPIEPPATVSIPGAGIFPSTVLVDQSVEPALSSSSKGEDSSVQLHPLDLSLPTSSRDKSSQPTSFPDSGLPKVSNPRNLHHNLPVSRFLNSPDEEPCKDVPSGRLNPKSLVAVTNKNTVTHNTRKLSTFSRVLPYVVRRPSSSNGFETATLCSDSKSHTPWDVVPKEGAQRNPEEVRVFESLYEHYWNQALQDREALYRQAKLQSWYQYPVVYAKLPGFAPGPSVPNGCLGQPWTSMHCVPLEKYIV